MNDTIIKAQNLHYTYEDGTKALSGIDLEIRRGRKIAFMGANGSGKSTFFLCLNGIHKPQQGTLSFHGVPYDYSRKGLLKLRSNVGIVFQDPDNQLFSASVYQEISFGILNLGVPEDTAKEAVERVIVQLEITPFRQKPTHALSDGQKKQVAIADILVMNPEVLIFDEPAASLDPKHTSLVNHLIDTLTDSGITVVISTHDIDFALRWADDVVLFGGGQILAQGTPEELFSNKRLLAATNLETPAVIQLFDDLCKKGILNPALPLPRTLETLEQYIEAVPLKKYYGQSDLMPKADKKAILVVSFGTSFKDTRARTIACIEADIQVAYPDRKLYCAWTSKMILKKILKRDHIHIFNVQEAMEAMIADGITEVIIQPTHVINGIENEQMKEDALAYSSHFSNISFGTPLLTSEQDNSDVIHAIMKEWSGLCDDEALVLMGHGTSHYANSVYAALDYRFKDLGYRNVFLGTVEAYPTMASLLKQVAAFKPKKIHLTPFMVVAGDHAHNDMAGDDEKSWRCQFEAAGFDVECHMKGLGEYTGIRDIFLQHAKDSY